MSLFFYYKIMPSLSFGISFEFFSVWNHQKNNLFFTIWVMFWNIGRISFFSFLAYKTLRAVVTLFSQFFCSIIFFWWKIYSFPFIFIFKRFNFCYSFSMFSYFFHNLMQLLQRIESIYYLLYWQDLLLLFYFLVSQENLHMIHLDLNLFYDIYNVSLFECIICSSSISTEEIELSAVVNWIFQVLDLLRLFIMMFILLRYSSTDIVLFLSPLLSYSI